MKLKELLFTFFTTFVAISNILLLPNNAEDGNCYFSNPEEFYRCRSLNKFNLIPEYPIKDFRSGSFKNESMFTKIDPRTVANPQLGVIRDVVEIEFISSKKIKVTEGTKSAGWGGINTSRTFIDKSSFFIDSSYIVSYSKNFYGKWGFNSNLIVRGYKISYINEIGNKNHISFKQILDPRKEDIFDFILNRMIKDKRLSGNQLINKRYKSTAKELEVTRSIIIKNYNTNNECFQVDKKKYPDLVEKYNNLFKTITPLREKLNLGPSNTIKPICAK